MTPTCLWCSLCVCVCVILVSSPWLWSVFYRKLHTVYSAETFLPATPPPNTHTHSCKRTHSHTLSPPPLHCFLSFQKHTHTHTSKAAGWGSEDLLCYRCEVIRALCALALMFGKVLFWVLFDQVKSWLVPLTQHMVESIVLSTLKEWMNITTTSYRLCYKPILEGQYPLELRNIWATHTLLHVPSMRGFTGTLWQITN